ncbi:hypothetical protein AVEN_266358-1 [Araneus ventricosus]|uniref:Uncharacterized protein n=1 Tax=Araneus ventricosus TaxID=182803 RepID=A0A4Y2CRA7_ARAVE|nr:hypothetical protein AVEN_266358-1 [Araneus ventricosus]
MSAQKNESRGRTERSDWPGGGGYLGQREKLVLGWDVSWISISLPPALCVSFRFPPPRLFGRFDGLMALRREDFAISSLPLICRSDSYPRLCVALVSVNGCVPLVETGDSSFLLCISI